MPATLIVKGEKFVVIPSEEYRRLKSGRPTAEDLDLPPLPGALPDGTYPASETLRASMARKIILARKAAGISQVELARRARIRVETLNRIERARVTADMSTIEKIDKALSGAKSAHA